VQKQRVYDLLLEETQIVMPKERSGNIMGTRRKGEKGKREKGVGREDGVELCGLRS
jgi:hypothetical protein